MHLPIFSDRLDEYVECRLSRTPMAAVAGPHLHDTDHTEARHIQLICWTPDVAGAYCCTGLYKAEALERAKLNRGEDNALNYHADCKDEDVSLCPTCFMEADEGTLEEQMDNIERVEQATGLRFALITHSGDTRPESVKAAEELLGESLPKVKAGKSMHVEMLFSKPLNPTKPKQKALRKRIQRLLTAILVGDPAVQNIGRLMRAGGVVGGVNGSTNEGVRIQTLIRADPSAHFTAKEIDRKLTTLCEEMYEHSSDAWLENAMKVRASCMIVSKETGYWPRMLRGILNGTMEFPTRQADREKLASITKRPVCHQDRPKPKGKNKGPATTGDGVVSRWDAKTVQWRPLLEAGGITVQRSNKNGYHSIECPFPHSSGNYSSGTDCVDPTKDMPGWFKCLHGSCQDRNAHDLLLHLEGKLGREEMCKYVKFRAAPSIRNPFTMRKRTRKAKTEATKKTGQPLWFSDAAGPLSELPKGTKIVILAGDLGSGKTYYLGQEVGKVQRALIIMHRRALSRNLASRLNMTDYQNMDTYELITREGYPKIVVTPNSLHKVPTFKEPADNLIILEETESTLSHIYGGTMRKTKRRDGGQVHDPGFGDELVGGDAFALILEMIKRCIDAGGKLLLSDAFPGEITARFVDVVCDYLGLDPAHAVHVVHHNVPVDWQLHAHDQLADVIALMAEDVRKGRRIVVACMSARVAVALSQAAKSWRTDKGKRPAVLLHYQGQTKSARDALSNVNESWSTRDMVIYSPTVDSGVSYDRADRPFDRRYLITSRGGNSHNGVPSLGWRVAMQMSRRVRDCAVKNKDITCYMDPSWKHFSPKDQYEVREMMLERSDMATTMAKETAPDGTNFKTALINGPHFEVGVAVETARRHDSEDGPELVRQAFELAGAQVVEHTTELSKEQLGAFREMWTALKVEHDQDKARAWFEANFISTAALLQLRHQADLDDDQRAAVERAKRLDFFGPKGGEQDLLLADIRGGERAMVRAHVLTRLINEGHINEAAAYDRATVEAGYEASYTYRSVQVAALVNALDFYDKAMLQMLVPPPATPVTDTCKGTSDELCHMSKRPTCGTAGEAVQGVDTVTESGAKHLVCEGEDPIAPASVTSGPMIMWAKLPDGVTTDMIKDKTGCPMIIDAADFQQVVTEDLEDVGYATMAGVVPMTTRTGPTDFMRMFLKAIGLKTVAYKRMRVGPEGKIVRIYTLDPTWADKLAAISERHYQLMLGESVEPLEKIDPKAPETARRIATMSRGSSSWGDRAHRAYNRTRTARESRRLVREGGNHLRD